MDYEVIVVGGGPVGMMLASELALAGVKVCILERLKETTPYSRALTVHPRTLELFDLRGIKPKFMERGRPVSRGHFAGLETPLDFSVLDSASNYTLFIPQSETEKLLEAWAGSLGVEIRREVEAVSIRQHPDRVDIETEGPGGAAKLSAAYVVGADGGRSLVRKEAGIPFEGTSETFTTVLGDVSLSGLPPMSAISSYSERGLVAILPIDPTTYRVLLGDPARMSVPKEEPVTLEELRSGLERVLGNDYGISKPRWLSRFGNATRQAGRYRKGRIFLAGDAAHIHFPAGGQGMNVGIQDAVNLGWKLAAAIQGRAPDWLLDSYHAERFPVGTALLRNTEVQTLMFELSPRMMELRSLMAGLLRFPDANRMVSEQIAAFDVRYESDAESPSHPLGGQRAAELELKLADGAARRSYELFHNGQFVLLQLDLEEGTPYGELWPGSEHVRVVNASLTKANPDWSGVRAALVRPDGHVAWAVAKSDPAPRDSVARGMSRWMKF